MEELDHVTLGAESLERGAAFLKGALGVDIPRGGQHPDMSTHNCVMNVGEGRFLELIAIDPDAPPVNRRRWFGLDEPEVAARLAQRPRGVGWVVRTDRLDDILARAPVDLGPALRMSRGTRTWRLTVPQQGMMPFDGLVPGFIEWSPGPHPSEGMQRPGPLLEAIELHHPRAGELRGVLDALGVLKFVTVHEAGEPSLAATFRLADGSLQSVGG